MLGRFSLPGKYFLSLVCPLGVARIAQGYSPLRSNFSHFPGPDFSLVQPLQRDRERGRSVFVLWSLASVVSHWTLATTRKDMKNAD